MGKFRGMDRDNNFGISSIFVLSVEDKLKNMENSDITLLELGKEVPEINKDELKLIIQYLDESNKIYVGVKGITWIDNKSSKMSEAIQGGLEL